MPFKVVSYTKGRVTDHGFLPPAKAKSINDDVVWLDIKNPTKDELALLQEAYGFHPLAIDDCLHDIQRPKIEEYDGYVFIILKRLCCQQTVKSTQIAVFVGGNYLATIAQEEVPLLEDIRKKILSGGSKTASKKTDFLLYRIIDRVVDEYFEVLDRIEDTIEVIEKEVIGKPTQKTAQKIFKVKKDLLYFRKPVWPTRDMLHLLQASGQVRIITPELMPYYRDIYDHIIQVIDLTETYRELASSSLDIYLSAVSNSMNEVIKVLTVLASIFLLPTLISGVYGMNYHLIPDNNYEYGFELVLLLMLLSTIVPWVYFRRKGWI